MKKKYSSLFQLVILLMLSIGRVSGDKKDTTNHSTFVAPAKPTTRFDFNFKNRSRFADSVVFTNISTNMSGWALTIDDQDFNDTPLKSIDPVKKSISESTHGWRSCIWFTASG